MKNYTPKMVTRIIQQYTAANTGTERDAVIYALAEEFGRNHRSIRAKLVREHVYVPRDLNGIASANNNVSKLIAHEKKVTREYTANPDNVPPIKKVGFWKSIF